MKKLAVLISALAILLAACGDKESKETASNNSSDDAASSKDKKQASQKKKPVLKDNAIEIDGVKVKVLSTEVVSAGTEKYQEKPVIVIKYAVTNHSTTDREVKAGTQWFLTFSAYQDTKGSKQPLEMGILVSDKYLADGEKSLDVIKKGATVETIQIYELKNETDPVLLKAKDPTNFGEDSALGTIKVNIKDAKS